MEKEIEILKITELFKDLSHAELKKIASIMQLVKVTEGEILTERDQQAFMFYVISEGNYMLAYEQDKTFTLHNTGSCIGWATVAAGSHYKCTGIALTEGEVLTLSGQDLLELLQSDATLADKIMSKSCEMVDKRLPFGKISKNN